MREFAGRLALVTGAGDGIGEMLARRLSMEGMRVAVQDIRRDAAERVADDIGNGAFPVVFDVSDREACLAAASNLKKAGESVSLLWINAGVGVGSSVVNGRERTIQWAFSVNALGVIWTAQAFTPLMNDTSGPRHVGVTASSAAMRSAEGDFPLYAMTKHATFAIGATLRSELAESGISTTILCPGLLNTNIWDGAKARPDRFGGVSHVDHSTGQMWRDAKSPDELWPHIKTKIMAGGGYLVCTTDDGETSAAFKKRMMEIESSFIEL